MHSSYLNSATERDQTSDWTSLPSWTAVEAIGGSSSVTHLYGILLFYNSGDYEKQHITVRSHVLSWVSLYLLCMALDSLPPANVMLLVGFVVQTRPELGSWDAVCEKSLLMHNTDDEDPIQLLVKKIVLTKIWTVPLIRFLTVSTHLEDELSRI